MSIRVGIATLASALALGLTSVPASAADSPAPPDSAGASASQHLRLSLSGTGRRGVLSWDAADNSGTGTYLLYGGTRPLIYLSGNTVSLFDLAYLYCVVDVGRTYTVTVRATDGSGHASAASNAVTITIPRY